MSQTISMPTCYMTPLLVTNSWFSINTTVSSTSIMASVSIMLVTVSESGHSSRHQFFIVVVTSTEGHSPFVQ